MMSSPEELSYFQALVGEASALPDISTPVVCTVIPFAPASGPAGHLGKVGDRRNWAEKVDAPLPVRVGKVPLFCAA